MKKLVQAFAMALAVLFLIPVAHAQGWVLNGPPKFTLDPTAPGGGPNPAPNGGTNTISNSSISLSSQSVAVSSPNSYVQNSASVYGSYTQNFFWQGYGPPDTSFTVQATYGVEGNITAQGYDHASSYAAPSQGGTYGDTQTTTGGKTFYDIAQGAYPVVFASSPGSFTASFTTTYGVLTKAGNPPNGTVQPTQSSTASASASYTVMKQ